MIKQPTKLKWKLTGMFSLTITCAHPFIMEHVTVLRVNVSNVNLGLKVIYHDWSTIKFFWLTPNMGNNSYISSAIAIGFLDILLISSNCWRHGLQRACKVFNISFLWIFLDIILKDMFGANANSLPPKEHHIHREAWWWQRHGGCFSSTGNHRYFYLFWHKTYRPLLYSWKRRNISVKLINTYSNAHKWMPFLVFTWVLLVAAIDKKQIYMINCSLMFFFTSQKHAIFNNGV